MHLIDVRLCDVNLPNGEASAFSLPQHAVVQTLLEALNEPAPLDPNFAELSLRVLRVLKQSGANMAATNRQRDGTKSTALEEFQRFAPRLQAFGPTAHIVQFFLDILSPQPSVHSPYYAVKTPQLPYQQPGSFGTQTRGLSVAAFEYHLLVSFSGGSAGGGIGFPRVDPTHHVTNVWMYWASTQRLPQEDIFISNPDQQGEEQGWPPEMMQVITSQRLHRIGVTKTSSLLQFALELDSEGFKAKFEQCFFERTTHVQAALKTLLSATAAQGPKNFQDYQSRLSFESQNQIATFGFQPVPFPIAHQVPDSSQSFTIKTWNQQEKNFCSACYKGDLDLAKKMLSEYAIDVNAKDPEYVEGATKRNQTYLYAACRGPNCQPEIVKLLLMHRASTKVPSGEANSLPVHALVINFVECTDQSDLSKFIPRERFDEYFSRLSEIARLLREFHADFNSMNLYGHSPLSELLYADDNRYKVAREHQRYTDFKVLITSSSARGLRVEAVVPAAPAHDAKLAAAYEFLLENPKLPDHTSQSISEIIWSEKSSDYTPILGFTESHLRAEGCGLVKFMDHTIYFNASTLELKLSQHQPLPISLVLCNWPQDCSSNLEEPHVIWQWLRPAKVSIVPDDAAHVFITRGTFSPADSDSLTAPCSWIEIEDISLIDQLRLKSTSIQSGGHKYMLSPSFLVEPDDSDMFGPGPICGYRIRWVPGFSKVAEDEEADLDTGGYDDVVQMAIAQSDYQASMLPISADVAFHDFAAIPAQTFVPPPPIPVDTVVRQAIPPPPAPQPKKELVEPPCYPPPHLAPVARRQQWFTDACFERIPNQVFDRNDPSSSPRIRLIAYTSCEGLGGGCEQTGLLVTFYSSNPSVLLIEEGHFLRVVGRGQATIHAYQAGNQFFRPTNDWGTPNSTQTVDVTELHEFVVSFPETRLKAKGYQRLYTSLQNLLNLGPRNLKWSPDGTFVTVYATADKGKVLRALWVAILGAHQVIEQFQNAGEKSLQKARKKLFDRIFADSPWVPHESPTEKTKRTGEKAPNPIRQHCKEYLQMLNSACETYIETFKKQVDAIIDFRVAQWMQSILDNACVPNFGDVLCGHVRAQLREGCIPTDAFKPDIEVEVLKNFFNRHVQQQERCLREKGKIELDKFRSCSRVFEEFRASILARVSNPDYRFRLSSLIQDFMIHLTCACRGLVFYQVSAHELIRSVRDNHVTSVTTATGSGKSTLMPLLLIAANIGIRRIAVTQPRRFAAQSIYNTICHYHGPSIVGYAMAGKSVNPMAPIVYITDGLLRTQLNLDSTDSGFDCIIIDEVHERSENIDACVALLAKRKALGLKMPKVILSSATLDDKVIEPFKSAGCRHGKCSAIVDSPFARELHYPDHHCSNPQCLICPKLAETKFTLNVIKFIIKNKQKYLKESPAGKGQMLVFMPSTADVISTVEELKMNNIDALPLYAGQRANQSESLTKGEIFISTNIAETSLTFPNLQVVIDLGKVQRPRLMDPSGKKLPAALMETLDASMSTLSQRMGRVGRTSNGHYIALFPRSSQKDRPEHIPAGLELFPADTIQFSLSKQLRCPIPMTLSFPGKRIEIAPLEPSYIAFPELGSKMMADTFRESLRLGCSEDILMLAACMMKLSAKSQSLVVSIGQKLLPSALPGQPFPHGDISVLLTVMRMINSIVPVSSSKKPVDRSIVEKAITSWCSKYGLDSKSLTSAYFEFEKMQLFYLPRRPPHGEDHSKSHPVFSRIHFQPAKRSFDAEGKHWNGFAFGRKNADGSPDMKCRENYEFRRLVRGSSIENVIQALSRGYPDNFYVHCAELDGPVNSYSRVVDCGDGGDEEKSPHPSHSLHLLSQLCSSGSSREMEERNMKTYYTLHTKSSLAKADKSKFSILFAINSIMFGSQMLDVLEPFRLGALSIAEPCNICVLPDDHRRLITRRIALHADDKVSASFSADCREITHEGRKYLQLHGTVRSVISRELLIRKSPELRVANQKIKLAESRTTDSWVLEQHREKLMQLQGAKDNGVFRPLVFMWKNLYNCELQIHLRDIGDLHIVFSGRRQQLDVFKRHMGYWGFQLACTPTLRFEADDLFSGLEHYRIPDPKNFGGKKNQEFADFKKRLHNVTADDLTDEDIFEMTIGKGACRESRMEAVTRIALHMFDSRVVGGFVRDWIVNGDRKHPKGIDPCDWVEVQESYTGQHPPPERKDGLGWLKWDFKKDVEVVPKDLDIELMTQYFDVNRFIAEVTRFGIDVDHHQHIPQRHVFLFDKKKGPFTADFIEPHFACLHTLGDFTVNCLCVSKFPGQIGLKMEYTSTLGAVHTLDVNKVIADCRTRQLRPMKGGLEKRITKMENRGLLFCCCRLHAVVTL